MAYTENNLDVREAEALYSAFELADNIVFRNYINHLEDLEIVEPSADFKKTDIGTQIRLFKIDRIVYDKSENILQKLTNVYSTAYSMGINTIILMNSDGSKIDFYMGTTSRKGRNTINIHLESLYHTVKGNFPGSLGEFDDIKVIAEGCESIIKNCFSGSNKTAVSIVSEVASLRENKFVENEKNIQGIEKMIDTMQGIPFSAVLIANPISKKDLQAVKSELETLYSTLKPFEKTVSSFSESQAKGISNSISRGVAKSVGESKSKSLSLGTSESKSTTKGASFGGNVSFGTMVSGAVTVAAGAMLGPVGASVAGTITKGISSSIGANASVNMSKTKTKSETKTDTKTETESKQTTDTTTNTEMTSSTDTKGNTIQIEYLNKSVKQLLDQIDLQLKRIKSCESFGMFSVASYFFSKNSGYSTMAASAYKSLISGDQSYVESSNISTWTKKRNVEMIKQYVSKLCHPVFKLECGINVNEVTATSMVSGNELALHLGFPMKSVSGISITECASFGRNIFMLSGNNKDSCIDIGNIYHMRSDEKKHRVRLKIKDLAMHTFITGATGSGKSNTVYMILSKLYDSDIKFLIIEPAKGEYKHVFGNKEDVSVYGTNPKKNIMLRINPFSFPEDIHILEHIDRLIEIFNVCWPMYAAMPAVLKEAVEDAYYHVGWNLDDSTNKYEPPVYPTFDDVLESLNNVINASQFSEEVKSNYAGALLTRVKSLTNGINGRMFSPDEISAVDLFEKNVIVDISRVGSVDTKALIMGVLVMKLEEYRLSEGGMNQELKHVTVLEEAHNLLKSTAKSGGAVEGADLIGKSVEMLSNIISEVRTYGEGFIVVDQAPGLLDASVIRNTNTKIILRLPDYDDRKLVGKAANLTDNQINELAKLPIGVAAVYHNDWIEPVLCHVDKFNPGDNYKDVADERIDNKRVCLLKYLVDTYAGKENVDIKIEEVEKTITTSRLRGDLKTKLLRKIVSKKTIDDDLVGAIICDLFDDDAAFIAASEATDIDEWSDLLIQNMDSLLCEMDREYQDIVIKKILEERSKDDIEFKDMSLKWLDHVQRTRMF